MIQIEPTWKVALASEYTKTYFKALSEKVRTAYLEKKVCPPPSLVFSAFNLCPLPAVRVVILGQDPYHGPNQAHGLSFSVQPGVAIPPSLKNIYKEIHADTGAPSTTNGNLENWAQQGVLLLNATLTVEAGLPGSHQGWGWETFTDATVATVSAQCEHVVFLLWGAYAQTKAPLIDSQKHLILTAPHPSPLSAHRGFLGCRHFSKTNTYLKSLGLKEIIW